VEEMAYVESQKFCYCWYCLE